MHELFTDKNFIASKISVFAKILLIISLIAFFLPLIILPFFNHACTDDYFGGYYLNKEGFTHYQEFIYNQWAGRFAATFAGSLFINKGFLYGHYYLHSLLLLLLNFFSLFFLISTINKYVLKEESSHGKKILLTLVFLSLELSCVPQLVTFVFWFSSALTYHAPIVLLQTEIALFIILLNSKSKTSISVCAFLLPVLIFIINGFNELYIVVQLFMFFAIFWSGAYKKFSKLFIIVTIIAYTASAAIVFFAPGDKVRMEGIVPKGIIVGAIAVLYHSAETLWSIFKNPLSWFVFAGVFVYGMQIGKKLHGNVLIKKISQPKWMPFIIVLFLIIAIGLPVGALKGGVIPERYLNGVAYFVLLLLLVCFLVLGVNSSSNILPFLNSPGKIAFTILFSIGTLCNTYIADAYKSMIIAPMYNTILSERETLLKDAAAKNKIAEVKDYNYALKEHLQTDYSSSTKTLQQYIQQKPPLLFFEDDLATDYSVNVLKNYYGLYNIIIKK